MKINIFSYVFWPEYFLVNELVEALTHKGHDISVQTSLPNYQTGSLAPKYSYFTGPYFEKFQSAKIYRYPVVPRKKSFTFLALNYLTNVFCGFLNLIRLPKGDVYLFFATSPLLFILPVVLLKKITRKPLVIWYQDLWPDSFFAVTGLSAKGPLVKILNPLIRFVYANTDLMLLQSPGFVENLERYNYKGRTEILYNWAPSFVAPASEPKWISELPQGKFILTFAGNLGKVQALDQVLEAAQILQNQEPNVYFAFVGEGSYMPALQKRAQDLNLLNVGFYGRKPVDEMPALFQKSHALLVSLKDDPTFNRVVPSKIQAYMTSGKPIVAFLSGVGADVVRQAECGVHAAAEDKLVLVSQIKNLVSKTTSEREQMGRNGQKFFEANFQRDSAILKLEKLLSEVAIKAR